MYDLCGWRSDIAEPEFDRLKYEFVPFPMKGVGASDPGRPIWDYAKDINSGSHLPTLKQETGDCLVAGSLVTMADGSEKPIEAIVENELVISHTGEVRKVVRTIKKPYIGEMVIISCPWKRQLIVTPDHLMAVWADRDVVWNKAGNLIGNETLLGHHNSGVGPILLRIQPLTRIDVRDIWVYCLEVEEDHSFVANGYAVHNCVSFGAAQAGQYVSAYQIAKKRMEQRYRSWFPPFIYYTSRVLVGERRLGRSAGSTGAWAAVAMQKYGVLFTDDDGVPQYSGRLADDWGYSGAPEKFKTMAADNPVKSAARLQSTDQIRDALCNYEMITYAISWVYGTDARDYMGYRTLQRGSSVGGHQVCLIAWMDKPFPAAYLLNSWGSTVHSGADNGEPSGGAWLRVEDIERDLRGGQTEVYALSGFEGFQREADFGILSV